MVLLTNDEFLAQLSTLFEAKQGKGTVFVTQKRHVPRKGAASGLPCSLVRATDGVARKLSTLVTAADAPRFHPAYVAVLKGSMSSLKKLKKAKKQALAKQSAI